MCQWIHFDHINSVSNLKTLLFQNTVKLLIRIQWRNVPVSIEFINVKANFWSFIKVKMRDLKSKSLTDFFFLRPPAFNFCQRRFSSIYGHSMRKKIINKDIYTRNSAQKRQSKYIFSRWANPVISMLRFCCSPNRFHAFKTEINMTHESKCLWKKKSHIKTD